MARLQIAVLVFVVLLIGRPLTAATIIVDPSGGGNYIAIQPAINAARNGDTVIVKPGEYVVTAPVSFAFWTVRKVTVQAEGGPAQTTIRMGNPVDPSSPAIVVFESGGESVLDGFTVVGGAIRCGPSQQPTIRNCIIRGNSGYGVWIEDHAAAVLTNCVIEGNGYGVSCGGCSTADMTNCTIVGNSGAGVSGSGLSEPNPCGSLVTAKNCIIWDNGGKSYKLDGYSRLLATYSCVEGYPATAENHNIARDPLFCGWGERADIYVDPAASPPGDGGQANPYPDLERALDDFSLTLSAGSPCLGTGEGGVNMGAGHAVSDGPVGRNVAIHLAAGTYEIDRELSLAHHASLLGAGPDGTVLRSTDGSGGTKIVGGLRTGTVLSMVKLTSIIDIYEGQSPQIADCALTAVYCWGSSPILERCTFAEWGPSLTCEGGSSPRLADCSISGGISCNSSSPHLDHCTVAGSPWNGMTLSQSTPVLESCIVYDNGGDAIFDWGSSVVTATFSCIEGDAPWPGEGNIADDPRFCYWNGRTDIFVDPANAPPGEGTEENPFSDIRAAFAYRADSLSLDSPCIGTGVGGTNMGAPVPISDCPTGGDLTVHLAAGSYDCYPSLDLCRRVRIEGAGAGKTVLVGGGIAGLKTGSVLEGVSVSGSTVAGIGVSAGQSPEIRDCDISDCWNGVECSGPARFTNCSIVGSANYGAYCGAAATFTSCSIVGSGYMAYVFQMGSDPVAFTNCIFAANAYVGAGKDPITGKFPTFVNCTFADNKQLEFYGFSVTNCIFWGTGTVKGTLTTCLVNTDPLFVKKGAFDFARYKTIIVEGIEYQIPDFIVNSPDYHLKPTSPAIDAGTSVGAPATDFDGIARPQGPKVDIGAYEFGDCNGNGVPDSDDLASGTSLDCNANGYPDECDIESKKSKDCNANGIPDECDLASGASADCNNNRIPDSCEIVSSPSKDCDGNAILDSCEIAAGTKLDCNKNRIPDDCDISSSRSQDVDADGVPDECQADCNGNDVPDAYEIAQGSAKDCNGNGIPDSCDIVGGASADCNKNGVPDSCDIASGTSADATANGIPDECEGGRIIPGDSNGDGRFDISDAVAALGVLFLGIPAGFPCGDGSPRDPANVSLIDWQPDGMVDISDAVALLNFQFLGGPRHALAVPGAESTGCVRIAGCPDSCVE